MLYWSPLTQPGFIVIEMLMDLPLEQFKFFAPSLPVEVTVKPETELTLAALVSVHGLPPLGFWIVMLM
jgi:hypothetical protein